MFRLINPNLPFLIRGGLLDNTPQPQQQQPAPMSVPPSVTVTGTDSRNNPVITDQQTGQGTGFNTPEGSFLGLDKKTTNAVLATKGINPSSGMSIQEANQQAQAAAQAQKGQQAVKDLGVLTPEQQNRQLPGDVNNAVATGGALVAGLAGATTGAGIGAGIGTAVAPGVGTAIGAVAGGVIGFVGGTFSKISVEKRQNVKEAFSVYKGSKSNMIWIINNVNAGKLDVFTAADMWDTELANFNAAERNLKMNTNNDLQRFLSGGADELANLEEFKNRIPFMQSMLENAMVNPNPNQIIQEPTDMTGDNNA